MYIIRNMLGVTLTVILSPEKHLICKPDLISHFVGNAEHASQTPMWPCEPWLALMLDLPGRALKWSDEWAPVSCHSLGGPEAIQLSAALPALTMMNTRQAADNTSNNYKINFKKKEKKKRDRWEKVWLPPFNVLLTHIAFRGAAWGANYKVCLCNYMEQDIQHPSAQLTKAECQTAQMHCLSFVSLAVCGPHSLLTGIPVGLSHKQWPQNSPDDTSIFMCHGWIPASQGRVSQKDES